MRSSADAPGMETGFVSVSGAPLYYEVAGIGSALVLLHQGLADCRMYDDQFGVLAQHHRVVRYDLHGFGRSSTPTQAYSHHEALRQLLDALGIERAAILGMSMGSGIAIDFALTYPERASALLLLAPGLSGHPPGAETLALATPIGEAFTAGDFIAGIELSVRLWVDGQERRPEQVNPAVRQRFRELYTEVLRRSRESGRPADPLEPPAYKRLGELGAIDIPILVVVGSGDVPDVLDQADRLASTIPRAHKVVLPQVAHLLNLERPAEVNRLILDFLAEVGA